MCGNLQAIFTKRRNDYVSLEIEKAHSELQRAEAELHRLEKEAELQRDREEVC